jgi:formimidoylglutamate deiminase
MRIPGFVNAHSHAFQRALRGRVEGATFWSWRDDMLALAEAIPTEEIEPRYAAVYREMRSAGYTAVGEFHYLGLPAAPGVARAAERAGIALRLLHVAYERGGISRSRQPSVSAYLREVEQLRAAGGAVGVAPHSVRACSRGWLAEIGRYAAQEDLVLHVHADEQVEEIEACLAEHGVRPIRLLADTGCLGPRTTVVHATHADDAELDLIAGHGARICVCPTTEANLGDGFFVLERATERGIELCIGSDSNVRIDPLEELRELDTMARRATGRRDVIEPAALARIGAVQGARALAIEAWDDVEIDLGHDSLRGVPHDAVLAAALQGCAADVLRPTT